MIGFVNHVNRHETCRKNDGTRAYSPKTRTSEAVGLDLQLSTAVFFFQSRLKKIQLLCNSCRISKGS